MILVDEEMMTVILPEEVDHYHSLALSNEIDEALLQDKINCIVFDYTNTKFMDSSGIGLLLGRERKIRYYGGEVRIKHAHGRIDTMIRMSGVEKIIKRYEE